MTVLLQDMKWSASVQTVINAKIIDNNKDKGHLYTDITKWLDFCIIPFSDKSIKTQVPQISCKMANFTLLSILGKSALRVSNLIDNLTVNKVSYSFVYRRTWSEWSIY